MRHVPEVASAPVSSSFYVDCRDEQASLFPAFVAKQPGQPVAWQQKVCGVESEKFEHRTIYNGGVSWRFPQCSDPTYIHHVDTGEWHECCDTKKFNKKRGILSGTTTFLRCLPMEAEMRDYSAGHPLHMCGSTPCDGFREVCLHPRRTGERANILMEKFGLHDRNVCLDVGPDDKEGSDKNGTSLFGLFGDKSREVYYMLSPAAAVLWHASPPMGDVDRAGRPGSLRSSASFTPAHSPRALGQAGSKRDLRGFL
eukprot:TRINITY_DN86200_c0_g1_i1.p1 TRINITY_DN86200_c0_g1~~TRINITY_DN86200_c0_g1_i1.p1  ORF type:complete len:254 (-),score=38.52 TRINITY_DN86200_c0_g1_i1:11-772(-)